MKFTQTYSNPKSLLFFVLPFVLLTFGLITTGIAQPVNEEQVIDKIIVKVNDEIVLKSELDISLYQAQSSGYGTEVGECKVLESLIINKMLIAQAEADSVTVEEQMIEAQLDRRMQYFVGQFGGEEEMEKAYGKGVAELKQELRPQLEEQLIMQKMQEQLMDKVAVTPSYVKKFFRRIPIDSLPYFSTEVEVGHVVKFPEVSKAQKEKTIKALNDIKQRVMDGEDFCGLALLYSQDPGSSGSCGVIDFVGKGQLVPEYEAAARKLQPGEYSDPVESSFGFHLIQLIERRGGKYKTRHILMKPDASDSEGEDARKYLVDLKRKINEDSINFEKAALTFSDDNMTKSSGGIFTNPNTASSKFGLDQLESDVYFVIDSMDVGQVSEPIPYTSPDGKKGYRLIYYKSYNAPHMANLTDDYIKISDAALNDKKSLALEEWFKEAIDRMYIDIDEKYKECEILN